MSPDNKNCLVCNYVE